MLQESYALEQGLEKDYLARLIREVLRTLVAVSGAHEVERAAEAQVLINETMRAMDFDPDVVNLLSRNALVQLAGARGRLEPLGLLLWEQARLYREGDDRSRDSLAAKLRRRSLALLSAAKDQRLALSPEALDRLARG